MLRNLVHNPGATPSRLCAPVGAASGGNGKHQEKSRSNIGSVDAAARKSSKLTSQGPPGDGTRAAARRRSNIDRHGCGPSCALTVESRGIGWEAMVCRKRSLITCCSVSDCDCGDPPAVGCRSSTSSVLAVCAPGKPCARATRKSRAHKSPRSFNVSAHRPSESKRSKQTRNFSSIVPRESADIPHASSVNARRPTPKASSFRKRRARSSWGKSGTTRPTTSENISKLRPSALRRDCLRPPSSLRAARCMAANSSLEGFLPATGLVSANALPKASHLSRCAASSVQVSQSSSASAAKPSRLSSEALDVGEAAGACDVPAGKGWRRSTAPIGRWSEGSSGPGKPLARTAARWASERTVSRTAMHLNPPVSNQSWSSMPQKPAAPRCVKVNSLSSAV
mmetsp:Transcript_121368/g.338126  ORF Transcript_121368/g.338126 Transcript_121368/m.338126 type:complete len:395 (+) Transcript_121368:174-1358(+)